MLFLALSSFVLRCENRDPRVSRREESTFKGVVVLVRWWFTAATWSVFTCTYETRRHPVHINARTQARAEDVYNGTRRMWTGRGGGRGLLYANVPWNRALRSLYFNLVRPLLDTNIIQLGIVSRRASLGGKREVLICARPRLLLVFHALLVLLAISPAWGGLQ